MTWLLVEELFAASLFWSDIEDMNNWDQRESMHGDLKSPLKRSLHIRVLDIDPKNPVPYKLDSWYESRSELNTDPRENKIQIAIKIYI